MSIPQLSVELLSIWAGTTTTVPSLPNSTVAIWQIAFGASVSVTVKVYEQISELLEASVAVQVMVVTPLLNATPFKVVPLPVVAPVKL